MEITVENPYNEIKQNIINNFFNKLYKNNICSYKNGIINDIQERCPFIIDILNDEFTLMKMTLGDGSILIFNLKWDERKNKHNQDLTYYKLIEIY